MRKKSYTRTSPSLFENGKKKLLPQKFFRTEKDLFNIYVEWFDYYDPIGFVERMGLVHEYEPEAKDLVDKVKRCKNAAEFAEAIKLCLTYFFCDGEFDSKFFTAKFNKQGISPMAESGWALWYRYQFDIKNLAASGTSSGGRKKQKTPLRQFQSKLKWVDIDM